MDALAQFAATLIIPVLASLPPLLMYASQRRQVNASAASEITEAAVAIMKETKEYLETRISHLEEENKELREHIAVLECELKELKNGNLQA